MPPRLFLEGKVLARASVNGKFSASHVIDNHSKCHRLHGHEWSVEISVSGQIDPKTGMVVDFGEIQRDFKSLLSELDNKHINDMLPGASPSHEGIAAYVRERMVLKYPNISGVSVWTSDYKVEVEWPIR